MSSFEYVASIYSIVLGLASANLLMALGGTLKYRDTIQHYWVHSAWCVTLLFGLIALWAAIWEQESTVLDRTVFSMLPFFGWAVCLYVATYLLSPDFSQPQDRDLHAYFQRIRTPFFCFLISPFLVYNGILLPFLGYELEFVPLMLAWSLVVLGFVGLLAKPKWVQGAVVIAWLATQATQEALQVGLMQR